MSFVFWEILIPLIIAFLLGLLCGWFLWGWRRTKITYTEWETMRQKANRASSVEAEAELAELRAENDRLQAQIDDHVCEVSGTGADLGSGVLGLSGAAAATAAAGDDAADDETADDEAADDATASDAAADGSGDDAAADGAAADADDLHPYGDGSHAPIDDAGREMPEGYPIKGNVDSMLYHRPDSRVYASTGAEVWFDTAQRAENNGFALAKSHPKDSELDQADLPVVGGERHPYGPGSHAPFSGDASIMPEGYPIKGNADSMLYHREDSRSYRATIAEVWFDTPESAEGAGFSLANSHPS